ncbi:transposable element Tcb1 transposase [Trichonephila clavipes]|nr:transposable element Tcb1 transposase [Trichonephila clavipes]
MFRRKERLAFDQVSEFDRGRIVAYRERDCGLSFREICSRVGRNQTTVMRICDRWMQEGTTDRRGRSHPPQCITSLSARTIRRNLQQSGLSARRPSPGLPLTQNHRRLRRQCQRYISEVLEPVVLPFLQGLATAIFQQDNARPHVARIVQRFFINHQIELFPWPAHSQDLSPIENILSMVAQRLTQITPPVVTPDQL